MKAKDNIIVTNHNQITHSA